MDFVKRGSLSTLIRMKSKADIHRTINGIFVSSDVRVRNEVVFIIKSYILCTYLDQVHVCLFILCCAMCSHQRTTVIGSVCQVM